MHEDGFYALNSFLDREELVRPELIFAFGIGDRPLSPSVGKFIARQVIQDRIEEAQSGTTVLPIDLCNNTRFAQYFEKIENN